METTSGQGAAASHAAQCLSGNAAQTWSAQYQAGQWDYLESADEAAHYQAICALYQKHAPRGSMLDVGCGTGILYRYLGEHEAIEPSRYTGIDFAQEAVRQAAARFPLTRFGCCDYSRDAIAGQFDCIVFNETLYYFDDPLSILQKSVAHNLDGSGLIIVSMYGEHHEALWEAIASGFHPADERIVENSRLLRWTIRVLRPLNR